MTENQLGLSPTGDVSLSSDCNNHNDLDHLVKANDSLTSQHVNMTSHCNFHGFPRPGSARNGRIGSRKVNRLITKRGKLNIESDPEVRCWGFRYLRDMFTTSVGLPWRYNILLVCTFFITSWILFSVIYYVIFVLRGDLVNLNNPEWKPCFRNFHNWKSALLYSIETQTTIGFGFRSPTEECGEAIFFLMFQTIAAKFLEAFVIGTFIGKFSRPKSRGHTLIFSKRAVINREDGKLVFSFRIGDIRTKSPIIEGHVTLFMIRHYITQEGAFFPYRILDMNVGYDVGLDRIFLFWPLLVTHVIDSDSPLYGISEEELIHADFEIVAIFEGIVEATGSTTQVKTSFLPSEIQWGYEFENIVLESGGKHFVDFQRFHDTRPIKEITSNSAKSAKELDDMAEITKTTGPVWREEILDTERGSLNQSSTRSSVYESRL